jgi:hypothetical protein
MDAKFNRTKVAFLSEIYVPYRHRFLPSSQTSSVSQFQVYGFKSMVSSCVASLHRRDSEKELGCLLYNLTVRVKVSQHLPARAGCIATAQGLDLGLRGNTVP